MKVFLYVFTFLILSACGADHVSNTSSASLASSTTSSSSSSSVSCLCTSDYAPVCAADQNKDYDNACLAKCFGSSNYKAGHCSCDNSRTVCGIDDKDYGECDAIANNITIKKYIPCGSTSL